VSPLDGAEGDIGGNCRSAAVSVLSVTPSVVAAGVQVTLASRLGPLNVIPLAAGTWSVAGGTGRKLAA
jgi:hypothetical protein